MMCGGCFKMFLVGFRKICELEEEQMVISNARKSRNTSEVCIVCDS